MSRHVYLYMRWVVSAGLVAVWARAQISIDVEGYRPKDNMRAEHTCDGADLPPVVSWSAVPGAKAYVLWFYDPDAPVDTFTHWLLVNYPETRVGPAQQQMGQPNDFGKVGYKGPCPPLRDAVHRYVFRVYALSQPLKVGPQTSWQDMRSQLRGRVLDIGEYLLLYQR